MAKQAMILVPEKEYKTLQSAVSMANAALSSIQKVLHKEETAGVSTPATRKGIDTSAALLKRRQQFGK